MSYANDFVVCPDRGPRRVIRHEPESFFPAPDTVSVWDVETNVLHINTSIFDGLNPFDKSRIMRTRHVHEYVMQSRY